MIWSALVLPLACGSSAPAEPPGPFGPPLHVERVADGFDDITDLQFPPGVSDRVVVLEKAGRATWVDLKTGARSPLLSRDVLTRSELGLLGLAFHPRYPEDPRVFINYNPTAGDMRTVIAEVTLDPKTGKDLSERVLLEVAQPYPNHDAGQLRFGPDGYLYVGLGDGGSAGDPQGHGQNRATLLGSMLRIDVKPGPDGAPYTVPADNPFVGQAGVRPEIWAWGLRNPWRFSFDPKGRLIVADVGQNAWEEVNLVGRGDNLGWNTREARHCFPPEATCSAEGFVDPIFEYSHKEGVSITGGYVAYGTARPALHGWYILADFGTGRFWALDLNGEVKPGQDVPAQSLGSLPINPSTFGQAADGTLYVADYGKGDVFRVE